MKYITITIDRTRADSGPLVLPDRLQVFVSSVMTEEDLSAERDAACDAIRSLHLTIPWAFEYAPAEPHPAGRVYLREVAASDLLVLIVSDSHTSAVQDELDEAEANNKPILAFVRKTAGIRMPGTGRAGVLRWLRDRVKYREFSDIDELKQAVIDALTVELVRSYRQFRLAQSDFSELLRRTSSPPGLLVRPMRSGEEQQVQRALLELEVWYPDIRPWIARILADLTADDVRVAELRGEIAGLSLSRDKGGQVRKFSTIYVRPDYQGEAIGPHLVHEEVVRAAKDGVRKAYVTFADELLALLHPILARYGFTIEGVSPGRYRPGAAEWVMGKTFVHGSVSSDEFEGFVLRFLVHEPGGEVVGRRDAAYLVRVPRMMPMGLEKPSAHWLVLSVSASPEDEYERWNEALHEEAWWFVSLYGRPANASHWSHETRNWIDGADLESRFFPVQFIRPEQQSLICTIRPAFADALIPQRMQPSLFAPNRLQIRPDNVFYRAPDRHRGLRRGSRVLFYASLPEQRVRGDARITELLVDQPEECLARYGNMGLFQFDTLQTIARKGRGRVLALAFDWYEEFADKPSLAAVRTVIPSYTPQAARVISFGEARALRGRNE